MKKSIRSAPCMNLPAFKRKIAAKMGALKPKIAAQTHQFCCLCKKQLDFKKDYTLKNLPFSKIYPPQNSGFHKIRCFTKFAAPQNSLQAWMNDEETMGRAYSYRCQFAPSPRVDPYTKN